jgi:hypothetical protein
MFETLYSFYLNKLIKYSRTNPLYQYPMLVFFNQGILWDIEKYKKATLFSYLDDKPFSRKEKRIYVGVGGRKKITSDNVEPYLRKFNYFNTIAPLLGYYPELTPPLIQDF